MDKVIVHIPLYISYNNCTVKNHIYGQGHVIPQQLQLYIEATTVGGVARNIIECGKIIIQKCTEWCYTHPSVELELIY